MQKIYFFIILLPLLWVGGLQAQTNIRYTSGSYSSSPRVSFEVWWNAAPPRDVTDGNGKRYHSKVWVLVDYKDSNGEWQRATISGTPTATAGVVSLDPGNPSGFWLQGTAGAFSSKVTVTLSGVPQQFSYCAYASDRPPVAKININNAGFSGTPPFVVTYADATKGTFTSKTTNTVTKRIVSLIDKTGCPSTDIQCIITAPALSGGTTVCNGASVTLTTTTTLGCTYSLLLNGVATGQTLSGTGSPQNYETVTAAGNYSVLATNIAGGCTATSGVQAVGSITIPAQPSAISGTTAQCKNKTGLTYSVTNVAGVTYTWTVPTGWSITAGQGTNAITVSTTASAAAGNITVTPGNACGNGTASTQAVTVTDVPAAPASISGKTTVTQGEKFVTYSITAVSGATGYTWTLPTGASIVVGDNTNSIIVNFSATAASGFMMVAVTNTCGTGAAKIIAVIVNVGSVCPSGQTLNSSGQCVSYTTTCTASMTVGANKGTSSFTGCTSSKGGTLKIQAADAGLTCWKPNNTCPAGWRLPTLNELRCMYNNRFSIGGFDTTSSGFYWSSEADGSTHASFIPFNTGMGSIFIKTGNLNVRCVQ